MRTEEALAVQTHSHIIAVPTFCGFPKIPMYDTWFVDVQSFHPKHDVHNLCPVPEQFDVESHNKDKLNLTQSQNADGLGG